MKRNHYFRTVIRRQNILKTLLLDTFLSLASWPQLVLSVFLRRNMGERHYSLASALTVAVLLFVFPIMADKVTSAISDDGGNFWASYATWYLFLFAFVYFSWLRWREIKRNPSVFDCAKFTLYSGDIRPAFWNLSIAGETPTIRRIETLLEPAVFFIPGLVLMLIGQQVGALLLVCSIFYSLSYCGAYMKGDNFMMDTIDEILMNEEKRNALVHGLDPEYTRGVQFRMEKPTSKILRQKVAEAFTQDDHNRDDKGEAMAA